MANNTNEFRFKNSARNAMTAAVTSIVMGVVSFIERMVFNQCFISDYLGFYSLFKNIISIIAVAELGLSTAIAYSLYAPLAEDNFEEVNVIMHLFRRLYRIMGAIILIAGLVVTPFMRYFVKTEVDITYVQMCFIIFLLGTVSEYFFYYKSIILSASQKEYINTLLTNICWTIMYVVQIIISIYTHSFLLYSLLILAFTLIRCSVVNFLARKQFPFLCKKPDRKITKDSRDKILSNVKGLIADKLGGVLINSSDSLLISAMIGSSILGLYSNYQMITKGILGFTRILPNAITASLGNMGAVENPSIMEDGYKAIDLSFYLIYGVLSIVLFNIINPLIQLFFGTSRMLPLSTALIICVLFYIQNIKSLYYTYKSSLGLYWYDRFRPIISGATNLIISIVLATHLGLDGILIGTMISYVVIDLWAEPMIIFHHGFHKKSRNYITATMFRLVFVTVMMLATWKITNFVTAIGLFGIIAKLVLSLAMTISVFALLYCRNKYVKQSLTAIRRFILKREK